MRSLAATFVIFAISVSTAQAQSSKPCPHRSRNFTLIGAGIGAAGAVIQSRGCVECGLLGTAIGAFWGRLVAEGTTANCQNDATPNESAGPGDLPLTVGDSIAITEPVRPEVTSLLTPFRLHPRIDAHEKNLSLGIRF